MTESMRPKGSRSVDIHRRPGARPTIGLGIDLGSHDREALLALHGKVNRDTVREMYSKLGIGATEQDTEELSILLDNLRITSSREHGALDGVLTDVDSLASKLACAIAEIDESLARPQSPAACNLLNDFRSSLILLSAGTASVLQTKPWERGKLSWHDDAFIIATVLDSVSRRENKRDRISFNSAGPANTLIAAMLGLAGIKIESKGEKRPKPITADGVKHALQDHPAFDSLNLSRT
jgi:hypothetical protein